MKSVIASDNPTITHLLGYLRPKMWADTFVEYEAEVDQELLKELIEIQGRKYNFNLMEQVNKEIKKLREG